MKHPDDYSDADKISSIKEDESNPPVEINEQYFEAQAGFLVSVKRSHNQYALSFKRKIGTPPASSISLTTDEAQRLSNILNSNAREIDITLANENNLEHQYTLDYQSIHSYREKDFNQLFEENLPTTRRPKSYIRSTIFVLLFLLTTIAILLAIFVTFDRL